MSDLVERLRSVDTYLNSLWLTATQLRDKHTGEAHADLNNLRHGIGAVPDAILEAADEIASLRKQVEGMREALEKIKGGEVEEYDEELRCPVLVPMDSEEAGAIACQALGALND